MTLPLAWGLSWRAVRTGRGLFAARCSSRSPRRCTSRPGTSRSSGPPLAAAHRSGSAHAWSGRGPSCSARCWPCLGHRPAAGAASVGGDQRAAAGNASRQRLRRGEDARLAGVGKLLDYDRLPVLTVLAAIGLSSPRPLAPRREQPCLLSLAVCLLLTFGRTTFGALADLLPAAATSSSGASRWASSSPRCCSPAAAWPGAERRRRIARSLTGRDLGVGPRRTHTRLAAAAAIIASLVVLSPAWSQLHGIAGHNGDAISAPACR